MYYFAIGIGIAMLASSFYLIRCQQHIRRSMEADQQEKENNIASFSMTVFPVGMMALNENQWIYVNQSAIEQTGYTAGERVPESLLRWFRRLPENQDFHDRDFIAKNGQTILLSGRKICAEYGASTVLFLMFTAKTKSDSKPELSHIDAALLDDLSDMVGIVDLSGRYQFMNRALRDALELENDNPIGLFFYDWHSEKHRTVLKEAVTESLLRGGDWSGESVIITRKGREIPVSLKLVVHNTVNGRTSGLVTIIRRLTAEELEEDVRMSHLIVQDTIQVQEAERQRLAQELHDGVGQSLYSILLGLQYLQGNVEDHAYKSLVQQWIDELHKAISTVKFFAIQLRPHTLDQLGLVPAIEQLISRTQASNPTIHFRLNTNLAIGDRFSDAIETTIFRIVQEAFHNACKHADPHNIEIVLRRNDENILLCIKDDGMGFSPQSLTSGLGLRHMKERASSIFGKLLVDSEAGKGTTLTVDIPI